MIDRHDDTAACSYTGMKMVGVSLCWCMYMSVSYAGVSCRWTLMRV